MRRLVFLVLSLALAGCASPSSHHVGTPTGGMFFNLPWSWHEVDSSLLGKAESGWKQSDGPAAVLNAIKWQTAWTSFDAVSASDVFAAQAPAGAVIWAMTRSLYSQEKSALKSGLKVGLQDVVLPVSSAIPGDGLAVLVNHKIVVSGMVGIEQSLAWKFAGKKQSLRDYILVGPSQNILYLFVTRCSAQCSASELDALNAARQSLLIKEAKVG